MIFWKCFVLHDWTKWSEVNEWPEDKWGKKLCQRRECLRCGKIEIRVFR